jgi:hypothetical protein
MLHLVLFKCCTQKYSKRMLGVYICKALCWNETVKEKAKCMIVTRMQAKAPAVLKRDQIACSKEEGKALNWGTSGNMC